MFHSVVCLRAVMSYASQWKHGRHRRVVVARYEPPDPEMSRRTRQRPASVAPMPCWLAPGWDRATPESSPARRSVRCCVAHRSPVTTSFPATMVGVRAPAAPHVSRRPNGGARGRWRCGPARWLRAADSEAGAPAVEILLATTFKTRHRPSGNRGDRSWER